MNRFRRLCKSIPRATSLFAKNVKLSTDARVHMLKGIDILDRLRELDGGDAAARDPGLPSRPRQGCADAAFPLTRRRAGWGQARMPFG